MWVRVGVLVIRSQERSGNEFPWGETLYPKISKKRLWNDFWRLNKIIAKDCMGKEEKKNDYL